MIGKTNAFNLTVYLLFNIPGIIPIYKTIDNNLYILVYKHRPRDGVSFWTKNDITSFGFSTNKDKFSIMSYLDHLTYLNGIYLFRLEYPDISSKYNEWSQTSNPMTETTVSGYTPINIAWTGASSSVAFNGLATFPSHASCYIKSYVGTSSNWWFALFSYANYSSTYGIPGPEAGSSTTIVSNVELWLRIR